MFRKLGDLFNFNQTEGANFPVLFYPFPQQIVALVVVVLPHVADYIITYTRDCSRDVFQTDG